jgi:hypothetical protein
MVCCLKKLTLDSSLSSLTNRYSFVQIVLRPPTTDRATGFRLPKCLPESQSQLIRRYCLADEPADGAFPSEVGAYSEKGDSGYLLGKLTQLEQLVEPT